MPSVDVGDTNIWYTETGHGLPCFVLHGGPGLDHAYLRPELDELSDHMRMIYVDLRGHGRSGRPPAGAITHDHITADLDKLREHLGLEQVALLGHSYGGFMALEYAIRYPDRASHLILVGTGTAMDMGERVAANVDARAAKHPDAHRMWRTGLYHDDASFRTFLLGIIPFYFQHFDPKMHLAPFERITFDAAAGARFGPNTATYDVTDRLSEIRAKTLILHGRHDFILPWQQGERMRDGIADAQLMMFEDSGHFPWIEERELFFATAREWLAQTTGGKRARAVIRA